VLTPQQGPNVFQAFAVDAAGNVSYTNSVKFNYLVQPGADWSPDSLNGLLVLVTPDPTFGTPESVGFDPALFAQTGEDTNAENYGMGNYTYAKSGTNTAQLSLTFTDPPGDTNASALELVFTNHYLGYFTNTDSGDTGGFAAAIVTNYIPATLFGRTLVAVDAGSGGKTNRITFTTGGNFVKTPANNGSAGTSAGSYAWSRYSPVCGLLKFTFGGADTGQVSFVQATFTNATSGVFFKTSFNGGALSDRGNGGFKLQ
jgi:hypothetical protein